MKLNLFNTDNIRSGVILLLLPILFYNCTFKNKKEKEILSAKLIYSIRAGILNDAGAVVDTIPNKRWDTIIINKYENIKKLQNIISNSDRYYGFIKMPIKFRLIVNYEDSEKKLFISGNYYKLVPDLEYYKPGSEKENKQDEVKYYESKENINTFCKELIKEYSKE